LPFTVTIHESMVTGAKAIFDVSAAADGLTPENTMTAASNATAIRTITQPQYKSPILRLP